jgi:hypothetical protein
VCGFIEESLMAYINATKLHRKSGVGFQFSWRAHRRRAKEFLFIEKGTLISGTVADMGV